MTTIEKLKELEAKATPGEWDYSPLTNESNLWGSIKKPSPEETLISGSVYVDDADFIVALRNLAPSLIALWEAANKMDVEDGQILDSAGFWDALDALNTKAARGLHE